jgi:hypothetical protein
MSLRPPDSRRYEEYVHCQNYQYRPVLYTNRIREFFRFSVKGLAISGGAYVYLVIEPISKTVFWLAAGAFFSFEVLP